MSRANASTFATELPSSPALVNDYHKIEPPATFEVDCVCFNDIDSGKIDLLSVDTEGAEWHVISNMVSRPGIISVETHGKFYTNPYIRLINDWMKKNNYKVWYKTVSDTVYYKYGLFKPDFTDYIKLALTNIPVLH